MVGIFLRLLDYHQGVLFLTTNRVKSFDSAFHSRISVALKYPDLDVAQRQQVRALACVRICVVLPLFVGVCLCVCVMCV